MPDSSDGVTRRRFIQASMVAAGAAALPFDAMFAQPVVAGAKYTRYNVMSPNGQKALASYAKGVQAMLDLPADHPQNWFRNAFIHLMDCPHGNWWFYVWHRGYLGYFEETIRSLSGDQSFAMPYWDWTTLPQIPPAMFDGPLDPQNAPFEKYTANLAVFTNFIKGALQTYWKSLTTAQLAQLKVRGYSTFDLMWNDVTGYDPGTQNGISGNIAYATTCGSRYLTRDNPHLDARTTKDCDIHTICSGLKPQNYWNANITYSFSSSKTPSHNTQPSSATQFSVLEGLPHNKVHNYIGGVGPLDPGPYGNMTNFLSPVDPIFFLHHSNMDRLWDVWTRKQQSLGLPILPSGTDLTTLANEPFLFYVGKNGPIGPTKAGDFFHTARFDYDYEPGSGVDCPKTTPHSASAGSKATKLSVAAAVSGHKAVAAVPRAAVQEHLNSDEATLIAEVRVQKPSHLSLTREFDVIVGAPEGVTSVDPDSPYYAGTIAFFGHMHHAMADMTEDAVFAVPLPKHPEAFHGLAAANVSVNIRVVPAQPGGKATALKAVRVRSMQ